MADERTGELVAYFKERALLHGFVEAFAEACTHGVPVVFHAGTSAFGQEVVLDGAAATRRLLEEELAHTTRRHSRAQRLALDADDEAEAKSYAAKAATLRAAERRLLEQLEASQASPDGPAQFVADTALLGTALSRIDGNVRFTQEEYNAFRMVVPEFRVVRASDGTWSGQAVVRVPTSGGVAEIGPIHWPVPTIGRGSQMVRAGRPVADPASSESRAGLLSRLTGEAGLPRAAAMTLMNAPFGELAPALLHHKLGLPLPEWIGPEWRDVALLRHLARTYTDPTFPWHTAARYTALRPAAQAVLDVVATTEPATMATLRTELPGLTSDDVALLFNADRLYPQLPCAALLESQGSGRRRTFTIARCHCGRPATTIALVPEVPDGLLCDAGHVAHAAVDSPERGLTFPRAYQDLRMTPAQWRAAMPRLTVERVKPPTPVRGAIPTAALKLVAAAEPPGLTTSAVAEVLQRSPSNVHTVLTRLADRGLLVTDKSRYPVRWRASHAEPDGGSP